MFKKLLISAIAFLFFGNPVQAQHVNFELSYQSFRPFIHFHLDYGSRSYHHDYESAYLKGYMDGVNDSYYYNHRYRDLVRDARIYEAGYKDGYRDRSLMIRLRGHNWYQRHRFAYNDYYDPSYSVRIWLDGLSIAFLQAPAHRLPHRWKYRVHPHVRKYRGWIAKNRYKHNKYRGYQSAVRIDNRYKDRKYNRGSRLYERQAVKTNHRFRNKSVHRGDRYERKNYRDNRGNERFRHKRIERSTIRQRKAMGQDTKRTRNRGAVTNQKKQQRKRGTVKRNRGESKKEKSSRGKKRGKRKRGDS